MAIKIRVRVEIPRALGALTTDMVGAVQRGVNTSAFAVEADAKQRIQTGSKSGRTYKRNGINHQASAAGESPATDTGLLVNSISTAPSLPNLSAEVRVAAEYGLALETGTRKMAPRPYLTPAVEAEAQQMANRITTEIRKVTG
jgi:cell pole-organizing protein PopZ